MKIERVEFGDIVEVDLYTRCDIHLATRFEDQTALRIFRSNMADWPVVLSQIFPAQKIPDDVIISLIEIPSQPNVWLFAGFLDVVNLKNKKGIKVTYRTELKGLIGRLKLNFRRGSTSTAFLSGEKYLEDITVHEVLPIPFTSEPFPGYENINISCRDLCVLVAENQLDWIAALSNMKGVYLVTDKLTGRKYVGSAYGKDGLWQRWKKYAKSGHGGNVEFMKLHDITIDYAFKNFSFSLLEHYPKTVPDSKIINRETHWKNVLLTRTHGYNKN